MAPPCGAPTTLPRIFLAPFCYSSVCTNVSFCILLTLFRFVWDFSLYYNGYTVSGTAWGMCRICTLVSFVRMFECHTRKRILNNLKKCQNINKSIRVQRRNRQKLTLYDCLLDFFFFDFLKRVFFSFKTTIFRTANSKNNFFD